MASRRQQNLAELLSNPTEKNIDSLKNLILHEPGFGKGWMLKYSFENAVKYLGFPDEEKAAFMRFNEDLRDYYLKNIIQMMTPREYDAFLNKEADKFAAENVKAGHPPREFRFSDLLIASAKKRIKWENELGLTQQHERLGEDLLRTAYEIQKSGNAKPRRRGRGDEGDDAELAKIFGQMHLPGPAPVERPPAPAPAPRRQVGRHMFEPPPRQRAAPAPVVRRPRQVGKKSTREGESLGRGKVCRKCGGIKI